MSKLAKAPSIALLILSTAVGCSRCTKDPPAIAYQPPCPEAWVANNGLGPEERPSFYYDSEGSELFPYALFLLMEEEKGGKRFASNLARFGLTWQAEKEGQEPLPIGLTTHTPVNTGIKMLGINCAACHVGLMTYKDKCLRIDGAPSTFDVRKFYVEMLGAGKATLGSAKRLLRLLRGKAPKSDPLPQSLLAEALRTDPTLDSLLGAIEAESHPDIQGIKAALSGNDDKLDQLREHLRTLEDHMGDLDALAGEGELGKQLADEITQIVDADREHFFVEAAADPDLVSRILTGDEQASVPSNQVQSPLLNVQALSQLANDTAQPRTQGILEIPELTVAWLSRFRRRTRLFAARIMFLVAAVRNGGGTPALAGRTDAFGFARNFLFANKYRTSWENTAPIGYPHLWGFSNVTWLHWNGNTTSVLERNIGQALGVGAIATSDHYTTVRINAIHSLEATARRIQAPAWPDIFPAIDPVRASRGKPIYDSRCKNCHGDIESPLPPAGEKLPVQDFDVADLRTDPMQVENFNRKLPDGRDFYAELQTTLRAIRDKYAADNGVPPATLLAWSMGASDNGNSWRASSRIPARPLHGIWASAPYLHNNSVRSLWDLLLPEDQRPRYFVPDAREFDTQKVGYKWPVQTKQACDEDCFDGDLPGNSVTGHSNIGGVAADYGTDLSDEERLDLIEYLKQFPKRSNNVERATPTSSH